MQCASATILSLTAHFWIKSPAPTATRIILTRRTGWKSRDKQPDWRKLLDRLSHGTDSPRDIDEVDSLIAQLENGTTGKRDAAQLHYDHPHGTGGAHDPLDRLIDTWAGI